MRSPRLSLCVAVALGACTSSERYLVVTVEARPAVHDARWLGVQLSNDGSTRSDRLPLQGHDFPLTFSVSAPGRTGELAIAVDAFDADGLLVGRGHVDASLPTPEVRLVLDSADFVVNTEIADHQFPSEDYEASGFQLAAAPDGTWTAAFRDACPSSACSLYARRFDATGAPVPSAGSAFRLTTLPATIESTPALAASATATLAVWDASVPGEPTHGVACRALDANGRAGAAQGAVSSDVADIVSLVALPGGNFVASWNAPGVHAQEIHAAILAPDCAAVGEQLTVSTQPGFAHRGAVAASGDRVLFAWIVAGDLHIRLAASTGAFLTGDTLLASQTALAQLEHVRAAAAPGGGFVLATRWGSTAGDAGQARIELVRLRDTGELDGEPRLVADEATTVLDDLEAFSIASRPDGSVMVAWHACGGSGDGSLCGVFGRMLRTTGEPITGVFGLPTTTEGDQLRPSVVGLPEAFVAIWADGSTRPPDASGQSVRARLLYPPEP